jgi:hypothetical protein
MLFLIVILILLFLLLFGSIYFVPIYFTKIKNYWFGLNQNQKQAGNYSKYK